MTIREQLGIIRELSGLTQTQLAEKIGVSFVAFNAWWNGKSVPRKRKRDRIDELYREYTGERTVPDSVLIAKKGMVARRADRHHGVLATLLKHRDIHDRLVLSLTYHSNKIEGSTLSEDEMADIMFNDRSIPDKDIVEQLEVRNHQAALGYLFRHLEGGGRIDEALVLRLHGILMNGIRDDAGTYRRHGVRIVGSNVPTANFLRVPNLMDGIIADIRKRRKDHISHISEIHARFEQIHPFSDGNGRIGRLILAAMFLIRDFPPAIIRQEEKRLYYTVLRKAQLQGDPSPLQAFVCDAVLCGFDILERKD